MPSRVRSKKIPEREYDMIMITTIIMLIIIIIIIASLFQCLRDVAPVDDRR